jgi:hypothetical protein
MRKYTVQNLCTYAAVAHLTLRTRELGDASQVYSFCASLLPVILPESLLEIMKHKMGIAR